MTAFANGHALLVGIDEYADPTIPSLGVVPRVDAEDVACVLRDQNCCGYLPEKVRTLMGRHATREAILAELDHLRKATTADSIVVVYYSGHGWHLPQGDYLLPANADASSPERMARTAISAAELNERLTVIPAGKLLTILDCCHAAGVAALQAPGPAVAAPVSQELYVRLASGSGRAVLAACASREEAARLHETDRNSLFTTHLLAGLRGKAATDDGLVKVFGLFEYVQLQVVAAYRHQHPELWSAVRTNFPVALNLARESGVVARDSSEEYLYDAYVAHAEEDFDWVFEHLIPALNQEGLRHTVSADAISQYRVTSIEDAILHSKYVLLVVSPNYTAGRFTQLAGILAQDHGVEAGLYNLIPVKIGEPSEELRLGIKALVGVNLTTSGKRYEFELNKLLKHLHQPPKRW
jgi:hypothetical protein